jgi:putative cell wall-binding protein
MAEIQRVLGNSGTVYLLGGTTVITGDVQTQVQAAGYTIRRIDGADRYQTAVAIADEVVAITGAPAAVFEATGLANADALTAAPAAAVVGGVVLLSDGDQQSSATAAWLAAHSDVVRYAVGGPAAAADHDATAVSGADRYATSAVVAARFFSSASGAAIANGEAWPDAAVAADVSAIDGAPLLLVTAGSLPSATAGWLDANATTLTSVTVYGGTARIGSTVLDSVATITGLPLS